MDFEYDDDQFADRILWGRVAVAGVAFLLAVLLGSCIGRATAGGSDITEEQYNTLVTANESYEEVVAARDQTIANLQIQLRELNGAANGTGTAQDGTATTNGTGDTQTAAAGSAMSVYEVKPGDTLVGIAQQLYNDGTKWQLIADANNLTAESLRPGQELVIPPNTN